MNSYRDYMIKVIWLVLFFPNDQSNFRESNIGIILDIKCIKNKIYFKRIKIEMIINKFKNQVEMHRAIKIGLAKRHVIAVEKKWRMSAKKLALTTRQFALIRQSGVNHSASFLAKLSGRARRAWLECDVNNLVAQFCSSSASEIRFGLQPAQ